MTIKRSLSLAVAGLALAAAPAAHADKILLKTPIAFGSHLPALGSPIIFISEQLERVSGGDIRMRFYEPGKLVPPFEILDAVSDGKINSGYSTSGYWYGKMKAAALFAAVPFGPEAPEYMAWLYYGNGIKLWQETYDKAGYNVKVMPCAIISPETSGWFKEKITSPDQFRGLNIRFFGLGGEVMKQMGANPSLLPGGEIFGALEKGQIDASEFSMPAIDERLGFYKIVKNNYFPGWHQQATVFELMINKDVWNGHDRPAAGHRGECVQGLHDRLPGGGGSRPAAGAEAPGGGKRRDAGILERRDARRLPRRLGQGAAGAVAGRAVQARVGTTSPPSAPTTTPGRAGRFCRATEGAADPRHCPGGRGKHRARRGGCPMLSALPLIASHIEVWVRRIGWWAAWLNVALFLIILVQVLMRYLLGGFEFAGGSQIILGELQWHLYAVALMLGLSYSQIYNAHIRVDAVSRHFSPRARSVVEILGIALLMYPFLVIMFIQGVDYTLAAWRVNEGSASPVGLPWRWLIKGVIPLAFLLLFLALTARLLREVAFLLGGEVQPQYRERFGRFHQQHIGAGLEDPDDYKDMGRGGKDGR